MKIFIFAIKISVSIMLALLMLWAGTHLTFAYYATDQNVHDMFAWIGPLIVLTGFGLPFAAIEEALRGVK